MYSLQTRTKMNWAWSLNGTQKQSCFGLQQPRTALSASHVASDHADAGAARMLKIDSSIPIASWIPSLTTSHNIPVMPSDAKWCQVMPTAKASEDHFACHWGTRAGSKQKFCDASLPFQLFPKSNTCKHVQTCANIFGSVICDLQNWHTLTHHFDPLSHHGLWNPALTMMECEHKRCSSQRWGDLTDIYRGPLVCLEYVEMVQDSQSDVKWPRLLAISEVFGDT